ncbi:hypothetical protein SAMN05428976_10749 [Clostridium sp. USBA 49]|uniref:hypothetical protein n=1 Tax=Clostridium TaxID=1485 RepID=UPI00099928E9|nr:MULTISPECIES: hypothetical protein [Clostridium]SKA85145.1 hypothetical protein SAMN05428976_10749 [Clostridium sp. USBA 49]
MIYNLLFLIVGFCILEYILQNKKNAEKVMNICNIKSKRDAKFFFVVGVTITVLLVKICLELTKESNIVGLLGIFVGISISAVTKRIIDIIKD